MINIYEVTETNNMVEKENLDVRTITMGISLLDCICLLYTSEILGIHFEGPYLDMEYKGAQPPEAIAKPTVEQFKMYQEAAHGMIKYITMAPEHDPEFALTKYCSQNGVVVSMGHSSASYEQALMGIANGAMSMTHVYNGMTPYHHRKPGLVGTALRVRDIYGLSLIHI